MIFLKWFSIMHTVIIVVLFIFYYYKSAKVSEQIVGVYFSVSFVMVLLYLIMKG